MKEIKIVEICKNVLDCLDIIGYEKYDKEREENDKKNESSKLNKQLIFPLKSDRNDRVSEQELRQLFIDVFKKETPDSFYSIETPTKEKYSFGKKFEDIEVNGSGQSALLDMCILEKEEDKNYKRILNIEFKYQNAALKNIAKDILKLIHEKQNGAFILLLKNTDSGTLCNSNSKGKGVLNKFKESFEKFKKDWSDYGETTNNKFIKLVIISLEQKVLIYQTIKKNSNLNTVFSFEDKFGDIKEVKEANEWKSITI